MAADAAALADRLLDAQVAFVLDELTGPEGAALVAEEVRGVLTALEDVPLRDVLDPDAVRTTVHAGLAAIGASEALGAMVATLVVAPALCLGAFSPAMRTSSVMTRSSAVSMGVETMYAAAAHWLQPCRA